MDEDFTIGLEEVTKDEADENPHVTLAKKTLDEFLDWIDEQAAIYEAENPKNGS